MTDIAPKPDPFARLRSVSKCMVIAVTIGMIALAGLAAAIFIIPAFTQTAIIPEVMPYGLADIPLRARMLGLLALAIPLAVFLYGLNETRLLFGQYALGDVLSANAARRLKRIAWITIVGAILRAPTRIALFLALSIDQSALQRQMPLRINAADLTFLLFGLLLLAVAWAMTEAARIAEEHRQIV